MEAQEVPSVSLNGALRSDFIKNVFRTVLQQEFDCHLLVEGNKLLKTTFLKIFKFLFSFKSLRTRNSLPSSHSDGSQS